MSRQQKVLLCVAAFMDRLESEGLMTKEGPRVTGAGQDAYMDLVAQGFEHTITDEEFGAAFAALAGFGDNAPKI
jgi:hypothetical protein